MSQVETTTPASAAPELDSADQWLLNQLQEDFPIAINPWAVLAERRKADADQTDLNSADAVLDRVRQLKKAGLIRQISAIFDTRSLGYSSTLVAARVPEERLQAVAEVINQHPGVSHNYKREAEYNLWFTLAVPPGESLDAHLRRLSERAGFHVYRPMPNLRTFRIGVKLNMSSRDENTSPAPSHTVKAAHHHAQPLELTEQDKRMIRATQDDIELVAQPFDAVCQAAGVQVDELKRWMDEAVKRGLLRRFAAILHHRSAGYVANGMVVWQIPLDVIEEAGKIAATFSEVSHCYHRPNYDDWPYSLYTMIHARSEAECRKVVQQIHARLSPWRIPQPRILYSSVQYKKTRVRYFVENA